MSCIIEVKNLWWMYEASSDWTLKGVDLCVEENELAIITGPNEAGKTTLARSMTGLIPNSYRGFMDGDVRVLGNSVRSVRPYHLSEYVGFVSSDPEMQFLTMSVEDEISLRLKFLGFSAEEIRERVVWSLSQVGLDPSFLIKSPYELSSGQKQRVAIAAALASRPKILILDEPLSNLDWVGVNEVVKSIESLRRSFRVTTVVIEHRMDVFLPYASRVALMYSGRIVLAEEPNEFFKRLPPDYEDLIRVPELVRVQKYLLQHRILADYDLRIQDMKQLLNKASGVGHNVLS
ncbi:MAG: ABC transporter ATP-binding protein [Zestosphaera sp.]